MILTALASFVALAWPSHSSHGSVRHLDALHEKLVPEMAMPERLAFEELLGKATNYLEFGCGGSTWEAVTKYPNLKHIMSVESSRPWVDKLMQRPDFQAAEASGRLRLVLVNIGDTLDYGNPADNTSRIWWSMYSGQAAVLDSIKFNF